MGEKVLGGIILGAIFIKIIGWVIRRGQVTKYDWI
jgi:hypothetical protein